jgi:RNA polymerase sigma-70 factor (ECF subfamily)
MSLDRSDAESELARKAQAGDRAAFDLLSAKERPRLVRWVGSLIGDADEAESIAQEAIGRAFAQIGGYHPEASFSSWLNGIALNLCRQHLRNRRRRAQPTDPTVLQQSIAPGAARSVLSGVVSREQAEHARQAIDELPIALREAFVLHALEHWDYAEIAAASGVAEGALRVRVHRARALLKQRLGSVVDTWLLR